MMAAAAFITLLMPALMPFAIVVAAIVVFSVMAAAAFIILLMPTIQSFTMMVPTFMALSVMVFVMIAVRVRIIFQRSFHEGLCGLVC